MASLAVTVALAAALGCSGSNPAGPGSVNPGLPGPTGGGSAASAGGAPTETQAVTGNVLDARTGDALGQAHVYVEALKESAGASGSVPPSASGSVPAPMPGVASPSGAAATPPPPSEVRADDKGHFELKDLPVANYAISVWASKYQAITLVGTKPSKLDVPLVPLEPGPGTDLRGKVALANGKPAAGVTVASSYLPGLTAGEVETSGADGAFSLRDLARGRHDVAAFTTNAAGDVAAFAFSPDVPVSEGKDQHTGNPSLVLHAVTRPLLLSGSVEASHDKMAPRQVEVVLATDHGEVPLVSHPVGKDKAFRFSLPPLPEGDTYHLIATGTDEAGDVVTAHKAGVMDSDLKVALALPGLPAQPEVATGSTVTFTWDAVSDVSAYRVRLETTGNQARTLWEGWTSMTAVTLPEVLKLLHKGETYRYSLSAIKAADNATYTLANVATVPWAWSATRAAQEFTWGGGGRPAPSKSAAPHPAPTESGHPHPIPSPAAKAKGKQVVAPAVPAGKDAHWL